MATTQLTSYIGVEPLADALRLDVAIQRSPPLERAAMTGTISNDAYAAKVASYARCRIGVCQTEALALPSRSGCARCSSRRDCVAKSLDARRDAVAITIHRRTRYEHIGARSHRL